MKSWLWKGMLAAAIAMPALSSMARAQSTDDDGCTNATLRGDYAFSVIDFILPQVVVGIGRFDGKGGFTQVDYIGDSLRTMNAKGFRGGETGSYTVNPDCTGSQEIKLNVPDVPAGTSHGVIENMFVISGGGRAIHGVVAEVTPPGATQPVRTQTRVDFWKGRVRAGKLKTTRQILSPSRCLLSADQGLIGGQPNRRNRSISVMTEEELPT